jgi:hypothetical protein
MVSLLPTMISVICGFKLNIPSIELRMWQVAPESAMKVFGVKCEVNPLDKRVWSMTHNIDPRVIIGVDEECFEHRCKLKKRHQVWKF